MKSSFCIDLQRFMLIPTKFPLTRKMPLMKDLHKKLTAVFCKNSDGQSNVSML